MGFIETIGTRRALGRTRRAAQHFVRTAQGHDLEPGAIEPYEIQNGPNPNERLVGHRVTIPLRQFDSDWVGPVSRAGKKPKGTVMTPEELRAARRLGLPHTIINANHLRETLTKAARISGMQHGLSHPVEVVTGKDSLALLFLERRKK